MNIGVWVMAVRVLVVAMGTVVIVAEACSGFPDVHLKALTMLSDAHVMLLDLQYGIITNLNVIRNQEPPADLWTACGCMIQAQSAKVTYFEISNTYKIAPVGLDLNVSLW